MSRCRGQDEGNLPPLPGRLDAADSTQLLSSKLQSCVGEALDVRAGACPGPGGGPGQSGSAERVHGCALLAAGGVAFAPEIIVDDVAAGGDGTPLVTGLGRALGNGLCRDGSGQAGTCQGQEGQGRKELHDSD